MTDTPHVYKLFNIRMFFIESLIMNSYGVITNCGLLVDASRLLKVIYAVPLFFSCRDTTLSDIWLFI